MIAFFCSTPYQVLLAIQIRRTLHQGERADIYILDHFDSARKIARVAGEIGVFESVQVVESRSYLATRPGSDVMRRLWRLVAYARYRGTVQRYFDFGIKRYDDAYFTYADVLIQLALTELRKRNGLLEVHLFEDGSGAYHQRLRLGQFKGRAYRTLGYDKRIGSYDDMFLLRPDLFASDTDIPVRQIPPIDIRDRDMSYIVNKIFDTADMEEIEQRVIFLEQPMTDDQLNAAIANVVDLVVDCDWIIKMHPRSRSRRFMKHLVYPRADAPWESICQNFDIGEKTLVTYFSTAAFTPKFVFGREPRVVFLHDLAELAGYDGVPTDLKKMVGSLRSAYDDPSRIYTPKSLEELRGIFAE